MTLKEKLREYLPDHVGEGFEGGVIACPNAYINLRGHFNKKCNDVDSCEKCWNQEYIEDFASDINVANKKEITLQDAIKALSDYCNSFDDDCKGCPFQRYKTTCLLDDTLPCFYKDDLLPGLGEKPIPIVIEE